VIEHLPSKHEFNHWEGGREGGKEEGREGRRKNFRITQKSHY
jgi:hypothetical protein